MVESSDGRGRRLLVLVGRTCAVSCVAMTFAWSPDGRRMLVGGLGSPSTHRLVTVSVATGRSVEIARGPAWVTYMALSWLQDGKIAYLRRNQGHKVDDCCGLSLFVAAADGKHPRRLWSAADGGLHDTPWTAWSPDGRFASLGTQSRDPGDPHLAVATLRAATSVRSRSRLRPRAQPGRLTPARSRSAAATSQSAPDGTVVRSLGAEGAPLAWSRSVDLFLLSGSPNHVVVSRGGTELPRPLFDLPANQTIVAFDPT